MSLSVRTSAMAGNPLGSGEDWGDSPYGSLITLGPKKFKKKPVLVLADEELAQAHLAMAMGGAEIMEMQPDPVAAPRPRQPSVMLGLVPMGAEEPDDAPAAWTPPAPEEEDGWVPLPDYDEPEPEEAEVQMWVPEDEPEDIAEEALPEEDAAEPDYFEPLHTASEPQVPSIEEQLERMRERLAKRAATTAAPAPPPVAEPRPTTIERLEIDDWSDSASLKGFIPPQEQDLPPALSPASSPEVRSEPAPEPQPTPEPQPDAESASPPVVARTEPDPEAVVAFEPEPAPAPPEPIDPAPIEAEPEQVLDLAEQADLAAWSEHVAPLAPARRHAGIRARLSDDRPGETDEPAPSLLARIWNWLRSRF